MTHDTTTQEQNSGTRTVPCHYCDTQVEPSLDTACESICGDCIDEYIPAPEDAPTPSA